MLDPFEARLTDLLADLLNGVADVQSVDRPRGDTPPGGVVPEQVRLVVRLLSAHADPALGDDARERRGARGDYQLQTVLHLRGDVAIDASISPGPDGADVGERRGILMAVVDQVLVRTHTEAVRTGRAFATGADLGFELESFRFGRLDAPGQSAGDFATLRVVYQYAGRFWPVEVPAEGDVITALPTRFVVLPVHLPDRVHTVIGGPDLEIPLRLDLRVFAGAPPRVAARLLGAAPPGRLLGDPAGMPSGWTGFAPDASGLVRVVYRPPAAFDGPARLRLATALAHPARPAIALAELTIELSE